MLKIFDVFSRSPKNEDLYIHHHLSLSAMIDMNGLIRYLLEGLADNQTICVFSRRAYAHMAAWMYRDEPQIRIVPIRDGKGEQREVQRICKAERVRHLLKVDRVHVGPLTNEHPRLAYDQLAYVKANVPYEHRFTKCSWDREMDEEWRVFDKLAPADDYVFVHDDPSRGLVIDKTQFDLPVVCNDTRENLFHLGLVLERAKEIHVIPSAVRSMVESLDMSMSYVDLFLHTIDRPHQSLGTATCQTWGEVRQRQAA